MQPQFKRIFVCYEGVKNGFLAGCRPFFGVDGCHLKGPYKGIFWLLWGLMQTSTFTILLMQLLELRGEIGDTASGQPWCIMSDIPKGLIEVVAAIPEAEHRYCCFHIENNMIKKFGTSQLRGLFWVAAETTNFNTFKRIMDMIKESNSEAHEWLSNIEFNHWTLSMFDTRAKLEHIANNFVESFNDWIEEHRYKPLVDLLEGLRMQQSAMMYARKKTAERWDHKLTPKVHQKVRGIPCIHAAACISKIRANIEDYCSPYFTTEMWRKTFQGVIHPIADEYMWHEFDDEELLPLVIKVQVGSLDASPEEMHLSGAPCTCLEHH
ncbi:uncharacterized protein LOC133806631 [Humulus lupulus]|uniref:uncharacterized protein LOC133806631 n=1 Tax=Humulus lupulus TaxID=3486 RepID=UPI002B4030BF|nr:uncharacterized protein LOC133806631 [Humulus lupulus]